MNCIRVTEHPYVLIDELNKHRFVVIDTETTGLDWHGDHLRSVIVSGSDSDSVYYLEPEHVKALKGLRAPLVLHNFKFDYHFLRQAGVDLRGHPVHDTMLIHHLLDENASHSLDSLVTELYGDTYKKVFWETYPSFDAAPPDAQLEYACKDVDYTKRIYRHLMDAIRVHDIPDALVVHAHQLALALYETEVRGVRVDIPYLTEVASRLTDESSQLHAQMVDAASGEVALLELEMFEEERALRKTPAGKARVNVPTFSFDSNKQLGRLLYDTLKLPEQKNAKTKKRTVDDAALETLHDHHPVIPYIREYRGKQKVRSSFIEGTLDKLVNGRIYPSFNVNGTVTGRISSSEPNLQQLPREGGIRGIYVPDEGHVLVSCDYKQLEVTIAAHFSRDKNLLKIVHEGASQHDITAKGLGIERDLAKRINFCMQYGGTEHKIASILDCTRQEALHALTKYWETYSGLKTFIDSIHARIAFGYPIVNPFGRRRRFPNLKDASFWQFERSKRQSFNALIQGTGADITHEAFYTVDAKLKELNFGHALFEVHDEILISARESTCDFAQALLSSVMVGVGKRIGLTVPLAVDRSGGMNRWED